MLRTLHPMIVHFPIALFYTTALFEVLYLIYRKEWLRSAGVLLLTLSIASGVAAGIAGWISEHYLPANLPLKDLQLINTHKNFAELSVFVYGLAWLQRVFSGKRGPRGAMGMIYILLLLLGLALISYTGYLGGGLVYGHGIGVP